MPMEIILLVNLNLLGDQSQDDLNIERTYSRYFKELVSNPALEDT